MRHFFALMLVVAVAAVFAGWAFADSVYHTERLALQPVSGAPGGGMVVNVHPNGNIVYAHEIYSLSGAVPGTYQVTLHLFATTLDCSGPSVAIPTATLVTNAQGNGEADAKFTPEDVAALRGMTFSINWTVSGPATYATDCTVVTLD
jgi:hypothetical protein